MTNLKCFLIIFYYALLLIILVGCRLSDDQPVVTVTNSIVEIAATATQTAVPEPTATATTSALAPSTATAFPTAINRPEAGTPTPGLSTEIHESETREAITLDPCVDVTMVGQSFGTHRARWRVDKSGNLHCCELFNTVYKMYKNPDLTSTMAVFSVITDRNVPIYSDNVLVDLKSGAYKILGHDYTEAPRYVVDWLSDGRLVWADNEGEIYTGSLENQESLNAPAKMTDLWFVPPNRILARDEALQFYYFDLTNAVWTPLPTGESEKITIGWIDNAAVSDDSDYVFFFFENYSAILSNDSGTIQIVSPFDSPNNYYTVIDAMEGDTWLPPQQIKGTPYWFFRTAWIFREFAQTSYISKGFIVDSTTAEVVGHDILGIPPELAIYDSYLSPDEMWVAVEVVQDTQTLADYPAEVFQTWFISLTTGEKRVEDGEFAGWEGESEDYLYAPLDCSKQEIVIDLGTR